MIDSTLLTSLSIETKTLKKDLTGDGWLVEEIYVNRVSGWNGGSSVVSVKNKIIDIYNKAPSGDKPKQLFIIGHVPVPRSGLDAPSPDGHTEVKGAREGDCYYADIDGIFTDTGTFVGTDYSNAPEDYQWDQDIIPSELEMAYGRIDFEDLAYFHSESELKLLKRYLNKLHNYKHVSLGWKIGGKSAFNTGFENSTDGAFRSLLPLSGKDSVYEYSGSNSYPQWVQENGPFMSFWQNEYIPDISFWETYGMDAILYSSDQSYWGYWGIPHNDASSPSPQALLATDTKCLAAIWTTTGVNIMHQTGIGESMGLATKQIIDHNTTNQKLEKPEQQYDDVNWWNRTHMQYHGDPTLKLFQVIPNSGLIGSQINAHYKLDWMATTDDNIVGHHVYKSDTEFGKYTRLTDEPIEDTTFIDSSYSGSGWYMVRAVKLQTSGSGSFLDASQGIFIESCPGCFNPCSETNIKITATIIPDTLSKGVGAININVTGGASPYTYLWSNSATSQDISGLTEGSYFVTVTDKDGCFSTESFEVDNINAVIPNNPPFPEVSYESTAFQGMVYTLDASKSYDQDNNQLYYTWSLPKEITSSSITDSIIYILPTVESQEKVYDISLAVSDTKDTVVKIISVGIYHYRPDAQQLKFIAVEASSNSGKNYPKNLIDNNTITSWKSEGDGEWVIFELDNKSNITHFELFFTEGDNFQSYFDILGSKDKVNWEIILKNSKSCGFSADLHTFPIPEISSSENYQYLKLVGHMNSNDKRNSYSEFKAFGFSQQLSSVDRNNKIETEEIVNVYPNPAINNVFISNANESLIQVLNIEGEVIYEKYSYEDIIQIDYDFVPGLFVIKVIKDNAPMFSKNLIIK